MEETVGGCVVFEAELMLKITCTLMQEAQLPKDT
jgi:hypothetical protein